MPANLVFETVIEKIKSQIIEGVYKPGDKLPTIKQLSAEFGVGESSVREAIRILGSLNILYIRQGSGVYVTKDPKIQEQPLLRIHQLERESITYLCEVRRMIEPRIAMLAAKRASEKEIETIKKLAYEFNEKVHQGNEDWLHADLMFHSKIALAAHNPYFTKMMDTLEDSLKDSRRSSFRDKKTLEKATHYHILIAEAIANRNPSQAGLLMLAHTDDFIAYLKKKGVIDEDYPFDDFH